VKNNLVKNELDGGEKKARGRLDINLGPLTNLKIGRSTGGEGGGCENDRHDSDA